MTCESAAFVTGHGETWVFPASSIRANILPAATTYPSHALSASKLSLFRIAPELLRLHDATFARFVPPGFPTIWHAGISSYASCLQGSSRHLKRRAPNLRKINERKSIKACRLSPDNSWVGKRRVTVTMWKRGIADIVSGGCSVFVVLIRSLSLSGL